MSKFFFERMGLGTIRATASVSQVKVVAGQDEGLTKLGRAGQCRDRNSIRPWHAWGQGNVAGIGQSKKRAKEEAVMTGCWSDMLCSWVTYPDIPCHIRFTGSGPWHVWLWPWRGQATSRHVGRVRGKGKAY